MKLASEEPLPKVLSTSQVTTYGNCPRRYAFDYVLKVPVLVKSEALEVGSRVHGAIAAGEDLAAPDEQAMVDRARLALTRLPPDPVVETTYGDRDNPGRLFGEVLGERFVGIFDAHWPVEGLGLDWKTGGFKPKYTQSQETQAYILADLFRQQYDRPLDEFQFHFLKTGDVYRAKAIVAGRERDAASRRIMAAIEGIRGRRFEKKRGPLCSYCEHQGICKLGVGFPRP